MPQRSLLDTWLTITALVAAALAVAIVLYVVRRDHRTEGRHPLLVGAAPSRDPELMVERTLVLVGSTRTEAAGGDALAAAWRKLDRRYARGADQRTTLFTTIGVTIDGDVRSGSEWLRAIGTFSEVDVGRSWYNLGATTYIWSDTAGRPVVPQVILLQQTIHEDEPGRVRFSDRAVLRRALGPRAIAAWADDTTAPPAYPTIPPTATPASPR